MAKALPGMDEFFRKAGFTRHKQSYKGKGYYFAVGGYDITKEDAIAIYKAHQQAIVGLQTYIGKELDWRGKEVWIVRAAVNCKQVYGDFFVDESKAKQALKDYLAKEVK